MISDIEHSHMGYTETTDMPEDLKLIVLMICNMVTLVLRVANSSDSDVLYSVHIAGSIS
jgi:hypothetical protein